MKETAPLPSSSNVFSWKFYAINGVISIIIISSVLIWYVFFRDVPLRISPETTFITEPLTEDGTRVDYVRAYEELIHVPGTNTDDNGYRVILRRLSPKSDFDDPETRKKRYEILGLDPNAEPEISWVTAKEIIERWTKDNPDEFASFEKEFRLLKQTELEKDRDARIRTYTDETNADQSLSPEEKKGKIAEFVQKENDDVDSEMKELDIFYETSRYHLWNKNHFFKLKPDHPVVFEWIEANADALDMFLTESRKSVFVMPVIQDVHSLGEEFPSVDLIDRLFCNNILEFLLCRAELSAASGDYEKAYEFLLAYFRLIREITNSHPDEHLFYITLENWVPFVFHSFSDAKIRPGIGDLRKLQNGLLNLPPFLSDRDYVVPFRFKTFWHLYTLRESLKQYDNPSPTAATLAGFGLDMNTIFKCYNGYFEDVLNGNYERGSYYRPDNGINGVFSIEQRSKDFAGDTESYMYLADCNTTLRACKQLQEHANMRIILLGMLLYQAEHSTLPPALLLDESGKVLHSWRVLLLPYIGEEELYSKIRLDEPWNSEHNARLHDTNVNVYRNQTEKNRPNGSTNYSMIIGPESPFGEDGKGRSLEEFGPNLVMFINREKSVCWMCPDQEMSIPEAETRLGFDRVILRSGRIAPNDNEPNADDILHMKNLIRGTADE